MKIRYSPLPIFLGDAPVAKWLEGELLDTGGVKLPNGKFLSVQPDGSYQQRDAIGGPYEKITAQSGANLLVVTPRRATFNIPYVEQ